MHATLLDGANQQACEFPALWHWHHLMALVERELVSGNKIPRIDAQRCTLLSLCAFHALPTAPTVIDFTICIRFHMLCFFPVLVFFDAHAFDLLCCSHCALPLVSLIPHNERPLTFTQCPDVPCTFAPVPALVTSMRCLPLSAMIGAMRYLVCQISASSEQFAGNCKWCLAPRE
jgi:hypothetical protein